MAYTKTYGVECVYKHGEQEFGSFDEATFLTRKVNSDGEREDNKVVLATLTSQADEKCYYWEAEGYHLEIYNGTWGRVDVDEIRKNNRVKIYTAYETEKVDTIAALFEKVGIDDVPDLSKYKILGEETPRKITNAEILEAINRLTDITLKLVDKLVEK